MDAFLGWLQITAAYAAIGYLGLMTATGLWVSQHPDTAIVTIVAITALLWYRYSTQIKRFIRVFLLWPPVRWYHRLVRKPIRYMTGVIMARWKRQVVADELDETLMDLCYKKHIISKQDYRRMSTLIGQTLGLTDLVSRKKQKIGMRKRILENIAEMKGTTVEAVAATVHWVLPKKKAKKAKVVSQEVKPSAPSLNYLKGRKAA